MLHARDGHNYGLNQRHRPLSFRCLGLLLVTETARQSKGHVIKAGGCQYDQSDLRMSLNDPQRPETTHGKIQ
jgi:hypothetical protein